MAVIKLPIFGGMIPAVDKNLLPDYAAQYSENTWLYSGALAGMPAVDLLHQLADPGAQSVYRIPGDTAKPSYLPGSTWMEFADADTSVVRAPVANDTFNRFYWTSASQYPMYNTQDRIEAGLPAWTLGIPEPNALLVNTAGGAASSVTRAYVATLVSEYGEEGPPSSPVLATAPQDAVWTITVPAVAAGFLGGTKNITRIRTYRSITSTSGVATFFLVDERNATAAPVDFIDNMSDFVASGRSSMLSTAYTEPPPLEGFIFMGNGVLAGWVDNEVWFSEPYRPHAWPAAYSIVTEYPVVGLGVSNQTLVICTEGYPVTASGVNPAAIAVSKLTTFEPCLSQGSIMSAPEGVYYTSPNGLVLVVPGNAQNVTRSVITKDVWEVMTDTVAMRAGRLGTAYVAFGSGVGDAFQLDAWQMNAVQQASEGGATRGFIIDPFNEKPGINYLTSNDNVANVFNDAFSSELLTIRDGKVLWYNQGLAGRMEPYLWRSKPFQTPELKNFSCFKAYFYTPTPPFNWDTPPNHALDQSLGEDQYAIIRIYADGRHVATRELRKSGELHRLPSGFLAEFWEIEIEARVKLMSVQMGNSVKELMNA